MLDVPCSTMLHHIFAAAVATFERLALQVELLDPRPDGIKVGAAPAAALIGDRF